MNRYEWDVKETFAWNWLDSRLLRGGPDVRFGSYFLTSAKFNTDKAKRMMFMLKYEGDHNFEGNRFNLAELDIPLGKPCLFVRATGLCVEYG